ncbi:hypothetical protein B0H10DRAFT_654839 [Mycena sp. CBHHK59/15]|nr:hypothetical protein B0H10DRAFT_654839 [Mycena sp. CBHHK59/15]
MRFSAALAVFTLIAGSASASYTPLHRRQFPTCANDCLAHPNLGNCKAGDDTCLCNDNVFVTSTFQCIEAACQGQDLANAIAGAAALCAAHVTLVSAAGAEFSATASLANSAAPSSAASVTAATSAASASAASASQSTTPNSARSSSANALLGLAALGAVAFAL